MSGRDKPPKGPPAGRANVLGARGPNRVARTRHGHLIYNANDVYAGRGLAKYGEHHEATIELFRQLCGEGQTVVDVGANIGNFTVALAAIVGPGGRVHAFEPQRAMFHILCGNVAINNLANVACHPAGVGATAGHLWLPEIDYTKPDNFGGVPLSDGGRGVRVPVVTLDGVLGGLAACHFVKIDVEGMERDVLVGGERLIRTHRPILHVENHRPEKSPAVIRTLLAYDYRLFWHFSPLFNPDNAAGDRENIFGELMTIDLVCIPRERSMDVRGLPEVADPDAHPVKPAE